MPFVTKARKRNDPTLRKPNAGLTKYEKEIFDIYSRALGLMANDLNNANVLRAIRAAIEAGNPLDAAVAFQWEQFIASLDNTVPKLASQVASSANISAKNLPKRIQISSSFTAQDPRAIAWAQQRAGARISGITKETQKAVAETIANGLKTDLTRDEVVARLRKIVGLDSRQARALGNLYEETLQQLLEEGYTYEEAEREATKIGEQYRERLLTQRATRIARTETLAAANAGRFLSWSEADAQGLLPPGSVKRWKTATDERTCRVCGPLHNLDVPWQSGFPTGDLMPPNHPNCRCTAVIVPAEPVFEKRVEKRYYRFADGEETWRNYDYRWRKIANELKRKKGKCERCGKKSDLTVDHIKRLKDGGAKYDRKNLRVLCRACNGKLSRLGTKLRKSESLISVFKHAPGKHDQKTHAGSRASSGAPTKESLIALGASTEAALRVLNPTLRELDNVSSDDPKYDRAYEEAYPSETINDRKVEVSVVENYAGNGYIGINRYLRKDRVSGETPEYDNYLENQVAILDKVIDTAPDVYGSDNLYRVYSSRLLEDLQPGDKIADKGFLSTTRIDISNPSNWHERGELGDISGTDDIVSVLMPSPSKSTKGVAVDKYMMFGGDPGDGGEMWTRESEVLLARNTELLFLGFDTTKKERVAVFQRTDK